MRKEDRIDATATMHQVVASPNLAFAARFFPLDQCKALRMLRYRDARMRKSFPHLRTTSKNISAMPIAVAPSAVRGHAMAVTPIWLAIFRSRNSPDILFGKRTPDDPRIPHMSRFHFLRCTALGVSLGLAAACLSLPAFADTPVTVIFPANSVWAQEVGNLTRSDNSNDYTVAVAAGKTLQLNLLGRNPNLRFKVKDQTLDKQLLDTLKTGESTWSSPNATATTYAIRVYIESSAIGAYETAKYALQVGQYGAADMQSPATAVTFEANKPWAQRDGILTSGAATYNFTVAIAAGMTVKVNLVSSNPQLHFRVNDQTHDKKLVDTSTTGANTWSESIAAATNYTIQVYADPTALPSGQKAEFALQVGQYSSGDAQPAKPASATTAVSPEAASSM